MTTNQPESQGKTEPGKAAARKMKFEDLALKRMRPPETGQVVIWDTLQKGLSMLLSAGGTKTFRATYCLKKNYITVKLGRVGEMALGEARKRTASYRVQAGDGIDPRKPVLEPKPLLSYEEAVDLFVEQWCKPRQRTWRDTERVLLHNFEPWLKRPLVDITRQDARAIIRGYLETGHRYKAAVALAWTRKLWRWAAGEDLVPAPLMDSLGIHIDKAPRERFFTDAEVRAIWRAADKLDPEKGAYFKLLVLLAPRKVALANMKWSDIRDNVWTTPHELTKSRKSSLKKRVYLTPLPALALRILSGLPKSDERVFPHLPTEPSDRFAKELIVHGAPPDFTFHCTRHTVATWLQTNGASEYEISLILNHSGAGVTAGYSHGMPMQLKMDLLIRWSDHIESLVQPEGVTLLR